jgi:hypothetical protein
MVSILCVKGTRVDISYFFNNLWKWKCGLPEEQPPKAVDFDSLRKTEWSKDFETYMRNRLIMGALRYGVINAKDKPKYDRIDSIRKRLQLYQDSGNTELLVDIANMALLEFVEGDHPLKHFTALDSGVEHANVVV